MKKPSKSCTRAKLVSVFLRASDYDRDDTRVAK